ncbi:MAG TPA: hypothetical protein VEV82_04460 [Actinomycetota bacterium]|nr:hypothetical protein [Actinomycetota bacterium]
MTGGQALAVLVGALTGFLVALTWIRPSIERSPEELIRANVRGARVPAVLGLPLSIGVIMGAGVAYLLDRATSLAITSASVVLAVIVVAGVSAVAGYADDRRGDEPARGFGGHLKAGLSGKVTGGLVKIAGVGMAGLAAAALTGGDWFLIECTVLVGLTANLINLLDRAPGRAAKGGFLIALPLVVLGSAVWATAAAGLLGALAACTRPDLKEEAMLGDAGANPVGAVLGLGLALSLDRTGRLVALGLLLALNLASERLSFSKGIERTAWLRALDRWGRRN